MATTTPNYGLIKPDYSDVADINQINVNSDTLDQVIGDINSRVTDNETSITNINSAIDDLKGLITVDTVYEDNIPVSANNYHAGDIPCSKSGYTPIGVVGFDISNATSSGSNASRSVMQIITIDGNEVSYRVANYYSSAAKLKLTVNVLYLKNIS